LGFYILLYRTYVWSKIKLTLQYGGEWWYRYVAAIGGVGNILLMMTANLVGFVMGLEGIQHLIKELTGTWAGEFL
jgi:hypothetical protein